VLVEMVYVLPSHADSKPSVISLSYYYRVFLNHHVI